MSSVAILVIPRTPLQNILERQILANAIIHRIRNGTNKDNEFIFNRLLIMPALCRSFIGVDQCCSKAKARLNQK
jgi:hypothetical protein